MARKKGKLSRSACGKQIALPLEMVATRQADGRLGKAETAGGRVQGRFVHDDETVQQQEAKKSNRRK